MNKKIVFYNKNKNHAREPYFYFRSIRLYNTLFKGLNEHVVFQGIIIAQAGSNEM